ncbi:MAG: PRC-barrel domain containing protein, partial [Pseudomonadota bacterium]
FIVDDENWEIRFLVVNTRNWLPGKRVLLRPQWIKRVEWDESSVYLDLTRESIKNSPEFDSSKADSRDYEAYLYDDEGQPIDHR